MKVHFLEEMSQSAKISIGVGWEWGVACLVKHPLEENRPQFPAPFQATADLTIVNSKLCPLFSEQHTLVRLKHLENCSPFGG